MYWVISEFSILFSWLMSLHMLVSYLPVYCSFVVSFEIRSMRNWILLFFPPRLFWLFWTPHNSMWIFRISLSISTKKAVGILLGIASDSKDHLEYYCHSKNIVGTPLVVPWLRICLPMQGTEVWFLALEDSTCCRATKPIHHKYWSSWALEPMLPDERPLQWEARKPQLEKALAQYQRPSTANK